MCNCYDIKVITKFKGSKVDIRELKNITKNLNLLYVEDNVCLSKIKTELFEDIFKLTVLAEDGDIGLEKYRENHFDLVITDINLPKLNGLKMLEEIFKIDKNQSVVVISAYSEVEYLSKLQELDIKHFLTKPAKSKDILSAIYESVKCLEVA